MLLPFPSRTVQGERPGFRWSRACSNRAPLQSGSSRFPLLLSRPPIGHTAPLCGGGKGASSSKQVQLDITFPSCTSRVGLNLCPHIPARSDTLVKGMIYTAVSGSLSTCARVRRRMHTHVDPAPSCPGNSLPRGGLETSVTLTCFIPPSPQAF